MRLILLFFFTEAFGFRARRNYDAALSLFSIPSIRAAVYSAESWVSSGDEKKELKLKAAVQRYLSKGDTDGESAAKLFDILQHPEKFELDAAKANAVVQTMANEAKYDLTKAKQNAQTYQAAVASITATALSTVAPISIASAGAVASPIQTAAGPTPVIISGSGTSAQVVPVTTASTTAQGVVPGTVNAQGVVSGTTLALPTTLSNGVNVVATPSVIQGVNGTVPTVASAQRSTSAEQDVSRRATG